MAATKDPVPMSLCTVRLVSMEAGCANTLHQAHAHGKSLPPCTLLLFPLALTVDGTAIFALNYHPCGSIHPLGALARLHSAHGDPQVHTDSDRGQTTDIRGHAHRSGTVTH